MQLEQQVTHGLDFIISLIQGPIWPRTVSTRTTEGRQTTVYNQQEALAWFKATNYLDCRINAYPYYKYISNPKHLISLVMIDLDLSNFKSRLALDRALVKTLGKIIDTFEIEFKPPVLWSGNGYHIYIPIESRYTLEERPEFNRFREPAKQFLRFAEWYLSKGKCDPAHNNTVTFANCMLRIPGSHNSKCIQRNDGKADDSTQVKIIDEWNGRRAPFYLLIGSFLAYLTDQNIKQVKMQRQYSNHKYRDNKYNTKIPWIETLLQTPCSDHRKYCIWRIFVPYLINVERLSSEETSSIIEYWLDNCNNLERLDFEPQAKINDAIKRVGDFRPIRLDALKMEDKKLYDLVSARTLTGGI
jgi:hypothetical protein